MRQGQRWLVDPPALAAGDLKYKDLMCVVVRAETGGIARSDIDVGVHSVVEIFLDSGD